MARLASTISLMRRGGTPTARASAVCDRPIGFRNSSSRISPGCGLGSSSAVVIDDFDIFGASFAPAQADGINGGEWQIEATAADRMGGKSAIGRGSEAKLVP